MQKIYVECEDPFNPGRQKVASFDVTPDFAETLRDGLDDVVLVEPPRHATTFKDLTETIAQTARLIQHLKVFQELAIVEADKTSPHADRKAIGIAAGMHGPQVYRILGSHGRPQNRKKTGE